MPYKVWAVNEILTAADMNSYVGNQTVLSFSGTAARATAIGTPVEGMVSYVGSGVVEVYAGTAGWTTISGGGGGGGVTVGTAAPDSPSDGALWWDSGDGELYLYYDDGSSQQWVSAAGPSVAVQDTAPTGYEGQLWLDSTDGSMYTYYTDPVGTASSWIGAVSRSGGILQVVSTTKTDTYSESVASQSQSSTDIPGFTVDITPLSTSSKILIIVNPAMYVSSQYGTGMAGLYRDGTQIALPDSPGSRLKNFTSGLSDYASDIPSTFGQHYLDSPSTTSTVTYSMRFNNTSGSTRTCYLNRGLTDTNGANFTRAVSSITAIEVAG